jgi:hypothetical protein
MVCDAVAVGLGSGSPTEATATANTTTNDEIRDLIGNRNKTFLCQRIQKTISQYWFAVFKDQSAKLSGKTMVPVLEQRGGDIRRY